MTLATRAEAATGEDHHSRLAPSSTLLLHGTFTRARLRCTIQSAQGPALVQPPPRPLALPPPINALSPLSLLPCLKPQRPLISLAPLELRHNEMKSQNQARARSTTSSLRRDRRPSDLGAATTRLSDSTPATILAVRRRTALSTTSTRTRRCRSMDRRAHQLVSCSLALIKINS